jgi:hypothetical protein
VEDDSSSVGASPDQDEQYESLVAEWNALRPHLNHAAEVLADLQAAQPSRFKLPLANVLATMGTFALDEIDDSFRWALASQFMFDELLRLAATGARIRLQATAIARGLKTRALREVAEEGQPGTLSDTVVVNHVLHSLQIRPSETALAPDLLRHAGRMLQALQHATAANDADVLAEPGDWAKRLLLADSPPNGLPTGKDKFASPTEAADALHQFSAYLLSMARETKRLTPSFDDQAELHSIVHKVTALMISENAMLYETIASLAPGHLSQEHITGGAIAQLSKERIVSVEMAKPYQIVRCALYGWGWGDSKGSGEANGTAINNEVVAKLKQKEEREADGVKPRPRGRKKHRSLASNVRLEGSTRVFESKGEAQHSIIG